MLSDALTRYLVLQRRLGLRFDEQERLLQGFVAYADAAGDSRITSARLSDWASQASSPWGARRRYDTGRRFALFLAAEDPAHEIPPSGAFGRGRKPRPSPHLLTPEAIKAIMDAALALTPRGSISPHTYRTLFGLLAATGLRISEALALQRQDLIDDGLVVQSGKFGKSRLVPLHPTTRRALETYLALRRRLGVESDDLFVVRTGRAPSKAVCYRVFVRLARQLGYRGAAGTPGPRLHDLRHSFAVRSLEACAHDREAVAHHMAALSTYLGHADIANTYWYLEATPALLTEVAAAAEARFQGGAA